MASTRISITLPTETLKSIRNGDDKGHYHMAQAICNFIEAVKTQPRSTTNIGFVEDQEMAEMSEGSDSVLTPSAACSETETFTLVNSNDSRAASPTLSAVSEPEDESFFVHIQHFDASGQSGRHYFPQVTSSTTIRQVHVSLHALTGVWKDQQRLLLNGERLDWDNTLASYGIKPGVILHLVELTGVCLDNSDMDFMFCEPGSSRNVFAHMRTSTTAEQFFEQSMSHVLGALSHAIRHKQPLIFNGSKFYSGGQNQHLTLKELGIRSGEVIDFHCAL